MKKLSLITALLLACIAFQTNAQILTQTLRGNITDIDGKFPLIGANVTILGTNPIAGTTVDVDGNFRFDQVPLGRVNLKLTYVGYEEKIIPNITLTSGKEVVLELAMQESLTQMDAVVVKATKNKGDLNNDMSLISARSVTVDETQRYAGSFNDPARMVSSFAGVTANPEGNNDIVVRGNSPKYVQWRLEGVEIPNPNHFGALGGTGGPISALNSNLLANSDFYTGAFSPEYGDVLSGVFDVKFRSGNNEKREYTFGIGALGIDATLEGPFKKGYAGSYLINYRYSSLALLDGAGLVDFGGVPKYQDAAFKINLPTKKLGAFSLFGMGGLSSITEDYTYDYDEYFSESLLFDGTANGTYDNKNNLFTAGLNHVLPFNNNTFLETTMAYSGSGIEETDYESSTGQLFDLDGSFLRDTTSNQYTDYNSKLNNHSVRIGVKVNTKINAKHKIEAGTKYIYTTNNYQTQYSKDETKALFTAIDFNKSISTYRSYVAWKYRLNKNITFVSGMHNFYVPLTNETSLEPRLSMKWQLPNGAALNAGFGKHSTMEHISNYYAKVENENGQITEPNKNLKLLKANHFVLAYEKKFTQNLMGKLEVYYQDLYDLPVENDPSSYYATINETEGFRDKALVNAGTGKNYGVELTIERFFVNNFYYMFTASVYNSKYKSLENIERNTRFNGNYAFNALVGKEFVQLGKKHNKTLALNAKFFYVGARKIIPLLRDEAGNLNVDRINDNYYDFTKAYQKGLDDVFQINASVSLKINKLKTTHEFAIDVMNVNNTQAKLYEYYDSDEPNNIGYGAPLSLLPNVIYRVYF
ncbi:TonB-dependent receptor [uncultured Arcticibacterium sp.]|uniref:TonB-dependent receptor n=1 Tax=uncultured Arcticibacterium sp. TaxID=2173042 RepID=UPI0030FB2547